MKNWFILITIRYSQFASIYMWHDLLVQVLNYLIIINDYFWQWYQLSTDIFTTLIDTMYSLQDKNSNI